MRYLSFAEGSESRHLWQTRGTSRPATHHGSEGSGFNPQPAGHSRISRAAHRGGSFPLWTVHTRFRTVHSFYATASGSGCECLLVWLFLEDEIVVGLFEVLLELLKRTRPQVSGKWLDFGEFGG